MTITEAIIILDVPQGGDFCGNIDCSLGKTELDALDTLVRFAKMFCPHCEIKLINWQVNGLEGIGNFQLVCPNRNQPDHP